MGEKSSPNSASGLSSTHGIQGAVEKPPRFFKTRQIGGMCENSKSGRLVYGIQQKRSSSEEKTCKKNKNVHIIER